MNNFVGIVGREISIHAVIKEINRFYKTFIYTIIDDEGDILIWETDKIISNADGKHYFLIEGTVKEHKESRREKRTILADCDWELVGRVADIKGAFCVPLGDELEFDNITASFRRVYDREWISDGEFTIVAPVSEYRLIFENENYSFMLPYDSTKRLTFNTVGKFNVKGKIIGYRVEKGIKTTFLYPISIEDKNGAVYSTRVHMRWLR